MLLREPAFRNRVQVEQIHSISSSVCEMDTACKLLEPTHARRVAVLVKQAVLSLRSAQEPFKIEPLIQALQSQLTGNSADYEILLSNVASLVRRLVSIKRSATEAQFVRLHALCARYAMRYASSYPNKGDAQVQTVLDAALRECKTTEELLSWIGEDTVHFYMRVGVARTVAEQAKTKPVGQAWVATRMVISLDRVLRVLLIRTVRSSARKNFTVIFDDDGLPAAERGALLELQLKHALDLVPKSKYQDALKPIVRHIFAVLSHLYTQDTFPLRRLRLSTLAARLQRSFSALMSTEISALCQRDTTLHFSSLFHDAGLSQYLDDLIAGFQLSRAFINRRPTFEDLKPSLIIWSQIVDSISTQNTISARLYDLDMVLRQLQETSEYLSVAGKVAERLTVLKLQLKLTQLVESDLAVHFTVSVELARCYLDLQCSERAGAVLAQLRSDKTDLLLQLDFQLAHAEYFLAIDNKDECGASLQKAASLQEQWSAESATGQKKFSWQLLHAKRSLLQSQFLLATGQAGGALATSKQCVKCLNGMWSAIERTTKEGKTKSIGELNEEPGPEPESIGEGIAKLRLTERNTQEVSADEGAAFFPLLRVITQALMQLSDTYAHHGSFNEADYYSERATKVAEAMGCASIVTQCQTHRSCLLVRAGRLAEAELSLALIEDSIKEANSLATVDLLCARAALCTQERGLQEALQLYKKAYDVLEGLMSGDIDAQTDSMLRCDAAKAPSTACEKSAIKSDARVKIPRGSRIKAPIARATKAPSNTGKRSVQAMIEPARHGTYRYSLLQKRQTEISRSKALLQLRLRESMDVLPTESDQPGAPVAASSLNRLVHFHDLMAQALAALQKDIILHIVPSSALSFPALTQPKVVLAEKAISGRGASSTTLTLAPSRTSKTSKKNITTTVKCRELLESARDCLRKGLPVSFQHGSTAQSHMEYSLLSSASLLLSALHVQKPTVLHPVREALTIEQGRMKALQLAEHTLGLEGAASESAESGPWSAYVDKGTVTAAITAQEFQAQYIDIIPQPWTVVSLTLDEHAKELHIVRYRSDQSPLILRLPFSRHHSEDTEGESEVFDYNQGKTELQEIIELSNHSCHSSRDFGTQDAMAKKWWAERRSLDKRLHELLVNIENIWLGGFKAILSTQARQSVLFSQFRKSFEDILDRYLPSRAGAKRKSEKSTLDSKLIELFVGLGSDQDGVIDIDEPLADLLYFAVDMLQLSGERNAYDEIDFDGTAGAVSEALRVYHGAAVREPQGSEHLILVLDKRLQAFPWESLPCLDGASVSRVGSMLSLRQRILSMRESRRDINDAADGCYYVKRAGGTYILNPSGDLAGTQKTMSPVLTGLASDTSRRWTPIVSRAPKEEEFVTALTDSAMLLYFGHGAGSQYIRPRTVKRLRKCSKIVWLMGCSSGAVTEYGDFEPSAVPLSYLMAGRTPPHGNETHCDEPEGRCMAVVATLWDVTDKDIDRFSLALGEEWGLWAPQEQANRFPTKTPRKRDAIAAPSTPQQTPRAPKTPKVPKTPAATKTPARARRRPHDADDRKLSLVEAVARSRDACYLRYLNGAAPVVYGVPVYLGD